MVVLVFLFLFEREEVYCLDGGREVVTFDIGRRRVYV